MYVPKTKSVFLFVFKGIVGAFVTWRWLSVACLGLSLLWSLAVLANPESHAYLMSRKDFDGARASLQRLRGHAYIETELNETQASLEEAAGQRFQISALWESVNLRPLVVALMLMVGQQLSGVNAVIFFSVNIFNSAKTNLNSLLENIIVGGVQVVSTALAAVLIDKLGRRILLITSALIMIISLYGLGLYFWIQKNHPDLANGIGFLPLSSLCLYIFAFSIGFGPIPWLMMSEIFSPEVKGITSSISGKLKCTNHMVFIYVTVNPFKRFKNQFEFLKKSSEKKFVKPLCPNCFKMFLASFHGFFFNLSYTCRKF